MGKLKDYWTINFIWPLLFSINFLYLAIKYGYIFGVESSNVFHLFFALGFLLVAGLFSWIWFKIAMANRKKVEEVDAEQH